MSSSVLSNGREPVAIIGMGFRFPGDNKLASEFAQFLAEGRSGITEVPAGRLGASAEQAALGVVRGGFLADINGFDARFFNISPREAEFIDPQQRLVLITAWEALEDANIDPGTLRGGDGGVYVGVGTMDYTLELAELPIEERSAYIGTGAAFSAVAGRVSYFLGMRGPSLSVDTACSSSLAAIHLAVQGLRGDECQIALAGGVNLIQASMSYSVFHSAGMLSPDGQCKTFDDSADGYSRSEGCGMLVLKLLSAALRDGDTVHTVIRGSSVRQDGESAGLTVPNGIGQEAVMRTALADAGLGPADIQYVEAHGTGTSLGDPIEMGSIGDLFSQSHSASAPVLVGSLKTNLGHMECAAGVGSVVKTALQMRDGAIYPHLNLRTPSTRIPWDSLPVAVPTERRPWEAGTRRALVNGYGFAGTLVSIVLEQPPAEPTPSRTTDTEGTQVFTVSAKSEKSLARVLEAYQRHLTEHPEQNLADLCYTSNIGRAHLAHRFATTARDRAELTRHIERRAATPAGLRSDIRRTAFLFAGQGAQYPGMAAALYKGFPVFREHIQECERRFAAQPDGSIRAMLLGDDVSPSVDCIHETRHAQPALFTFEYALAKLWMSWGIRPSALIGHSIGELTAATIAGTFSLDDAVAVVAARGRLMQAVTTPGRMAAITAPAEEILSLIEGYHDLSLAAINSPRHCVISGAEPTVTVVAGQLREHGVEVKYLTTSHAFHSPLMADAAAAFRSVLAGIQLREPCLPIVSNLTGRIARRGELTTPEYWVRHLREPVRFAESVRTVAERGRHLFVEIGPSAALTGLARQCVPVEEHRWLTSQRRGDTGHHAIHDAVAQAYETGLPLSWTAYHAGSPRRKLNLPRYQFDEHRYQLPANPVRGADPAAMHPLLGKEITSDDQHAAGIRDFTAVLGADQPAYLADHVVMGQTVFPGAGYVELLLAAQEAAFGQTNRPLREVRIHEALFLPADAPTRIHTTLTIQPEGGAMVRITSRVEGRDGSIERQHVTGRIGTAAEIALAPSETGATLRELAEHAAMPDEQITESEIYQAFSGIGIDYGPEFRRVEKLARHGRLAVAELRGADTPVTEVLPPKILDAAMHAIAVLAEERSYLPVGFGELRLFRKPKAPLLHSLVRIATPDPDTAELCADLLLTDEAGPILELRGLALKEVVNTSAARSQLRHEPRWIKRALVAGPRPAARHVLVLGRPVGLTAALAEPIIAAGGTLTVAETPEECAAALARRPPTDVCWFWRYPAQIGQADQVAAMRTECEHNYRDLLAVLAVLEHAGFGRDQRLWLITEAGQHLPGDPTEPATRLAAATLWGFGQSLWNEYPRYRVTMVDLPDGGDDPALAGEWLGAEAAEFQLAYRAGHRHVRRLRPVTREDDQNFELAITRYGAFSEVRPVPVPDTPPQGDEIQVRVHAAGLNFKDVLNALGILKQYAQDINVEYQPQPLGFECAGTVLAAGPEAAFAVGAEVIVNWLGCMRRRITVPSRLAVAKPVRVGFAEAAGIPTAYSTAYYALHHLAKIKPGDRILIHAAAGGVGQAAAQLAKLAGAEVFATASPHKWPLLHRQGITHVMNSRTLDFADQISEITGGRGVDIVLNSLNKDYIPVSMRCLATDGRFIEMGKVGSWTPQEAHTHRPDVEYHRFDLSELPEQQSRDLTGQILRTVVEHIDAGVLDPVPVTAYTLDEIEEAFGALSRGANIGKLIITFHDDLLAPARLAAIDADHTYVITGGLGGMAALTAHKLVDLGARHLVLVSRRGTPVEEAKESLARLAERTEVSILRGDVAEREDVRRIMDTIATSGHLVGGIIHAAGVLADIPATGTDWDTIERVLRPKVYGGWLLHEAANTLPDLSFYVCYSSVTSIFGQAGQTNYAAGNAFLDNLMLWRASAGQPALSINWGPVAELGMSARLDDQHMKSHQARGVQLLRPREAMRELATVLYHPGGQVMIGDCDWTKYDAAKGIPNALYQHLISTGDATIEQIDLNQLATVPRTERTEAISRFVRAKIGYVLRMDHADDLDSDAVFAELGLDSLLAVEFKNALEAVFRVPLPASVAFDQPSVGQLAEFIDSQLVPTSEPVGVS